MGKFYSYDSTKITIFSILILIIFYVLFFLILLNYNINLYLIYLADQINYNNFLLRNLLNHHRSHRLKHQKL